MRGVLLCNLSMPKDAAPQSFWPKENSDLQELAERFTQTTLLELAKELKKGSSAAALAVYQIRCGLMDEVEFSCLSERGAHSNNLTVLHDFLVLHYPATMGKNNGVRRLSLEIFNRDHAVLA